MSPVSAFVLVISFCNVLYKIGVTKFIEPICIDIESYLHMGRRLDSHVTSPQIWNIFEYGFEYLWVWTCTILDVTCTKYLIIEGLEWILTQNNFKMTNGCFIIMFFVFLIIINIGSFICFYLYIMANTVKLHIYLFENSENWLIE